MADELRLTPEEWLDQLRQELRRRGAWPRTTDYYTPLSARTAAWFALGLSPVEAAEHLAGPSPGGELEREREG